MTSETTEYYTGATLGLRLGLMACFLLLGVLPLIRFYVSYRLNAGADDIFFQLPFDIWIILTGVFAVLMLVSVVLTWRGRPSQMRVWFQVVVLGAIMSICVEAAVRYFDDCGAETCVISPSDDVFNRVFLFLIPIQLLIALYTLWYINRPPAREFFDQFREQSEP